MRARASAHKRDSRNRVVATILIGTEVPEGMGHVAPWLDLCNLAIGHKHTVHMAGPDQMVMQRCIASKAGVKIWAAPRVNPVGEQICVRSWPQLLVSLGYAQPDWLAGAVATWLNILKAVQPNLVLTDYAPALMLACHALGVRYVEAGNAFCVPPLNPDGSIPPFPGISTSDFAAIQGSRTAQTLLTHAARHAIKAVDLTGDLITLNDWNELYLHSYRRFAKCPPELDHYDERNQRIAPVEHVGFLGLLDLIRSKNPKEHDRRPTEIHSIKNEQMGFRIVGYLKPNTPNLKSILQAIQKTNWPSIIYCPGGSIGSSSTVKLTQNPLVLKSLLSEKTVFVTNGGLASVGLALYRQSQVLVAPQQAEQLALTRRLKKTGLGDLFQQHKLTTDLSFKRLDFDSNRIAEEQILDLVS